VTVTVRRTVDRVTLTVTDDGVGFDPGARPVVGHVGLATIYGRARAAGGSSTVISAPGEGTTAVVELPLVQPDTGSRRFGRPYRRSGGVAAGAGLDRGPGAERVRERRVGQRIVNGPVAAQAGAEGEGAEEQDQQAGARDRVGGPG
jgi:hypothetical protein